MPAGPIGSTWQSGSWADTAWEAGSWADAAPPGTDFAFIYIDNEAMAWPSVTQAAAWPTATAESLATPAISDEAFHVQL